MNTFAIVVLTISANQAPVNLARNGDFSAGINGWYAQDGGVGKFAVIPDRRFGHVVEANLGEAGGKPFWDVGVGQTNQVSIPKGARLQLTFWARSDTSSRLRVYGQLNAPPYPATLDLTATLAAAWTKYSVLGIADREFRPDEFGFGFQMNFGPGSLQIADVRLQSEVGANGRTDVAVLAEGLADAKATNVQTSRNNGVFRAAFAPAKDSQPWSCVVHIPNLRPIFPNSTVRLAVTARSAQRSNVGFFVEQAAAPNPKFISAPMKLTAEWKDYVIAGRVERGFAAGEAQVAIFLGYGPGEMEIKQIQLYDMGGTPLESVAQTLDYYGGQPYTDDWLPSARARIEKIRKGALTVRVQDSKGKPLPNVAISVEQLSHEFKFGTAVTADLLTSDTPDARKYREVLKSLFNTVVFENDLKWQTLGDPDYTRVDQAFSWLEANHYQIRGHNLVWGSFQNLPSGLAEKSNAEITEILKRRVQNTVRRFGDRVYVWDVVNEAVSERALWDRIGWDKFAAVFKWAREVNPRVGLAYNDFDILEESQVGSKKRKDFEGLVRRLRTDGGPVSMLGSQGHVSTPLTPPSVLLRNLDELSAFGLPIEITEFDVGVQDQVVNAKYTRDYMTAMFSHPAVSAFLTWGFWERSHWRAREGSALFSADWTVRKPGQAFYDLIKKEWWTRFSGKSNAGGTIGLRGFYGRYRVTAVRGEKRAEAEVDLRKGGSASVTLNLP